MELRLLSVVTRSTRSIPFRACIRVDAAKLLLSFYFPSPPPFLPLSSAFLLCFRSLPRSNRKRYDDLAASVYHVSFVPRVSVDLRMRARKWGMLVREVCCIEVVEMSGSIDEVRFIRIGVYHAMVTRLKNRLGPSFYP